MTISVRYISDKKNNPVAVQLPIKDWEKVLLKVKKYEQMVALKDSLTKSFKEVVALKASKTKKQNLKEFLDGL